MSVNQAGATFVSKGIKYVLNYGPKGNLRPYTLGPIKSATKTGNPFVIAVAVVFAVAGVGYYLWKGNKEQA